MPWPSLERLAEKRLRELLGDDYAALPTDQRLDAIKLGTQWIKMKKAAEQGCEMGSFFRDVDDDTSGDG